jgi:hypothetical protein
VEAARRVDGDDPGGVAEEEQVDRFQVRRRFQRPRLLVGDEEARMHEEMIPSGASAQRRFRP